MKILILGAAGFIGANIAKTLSKNPKNNLTLVDNYFRGSNDKFINDIIISDNCTFIECDLTNPDSFKRFDHDYDQVYFLASVVGVGFTSQYPRRVIEINTKIILNTLEWLACISAKPKVLFSSTSESYASSIDLKVGNIPSSEDIPLSVRNIFEPRYTYAITKILGEAGIIHYANDVGFDYVILRYHNVYGPRMGFSHVIPQVVKRFFEKEEPFKIFGWDQTRSFNFIDDAVNGTILAMNSNSNSKLFHIGSEEEISIESLVRFIGKLLNYEGEYRNDISHIGSVSRRCPDITRARRELKYEPQILWQDGVTATVDWYANYYKNQ